MARIITGYTGVPHVTAQDDAAFQKIVGLYDYFIKQTANDDNPTAVEVSSGKIKLPRMNIIMQGVHAEVEGTEEITIESGSQGQYRIDLVCAKYYKNPSNDVEDVEIEVVKGTPAGSSPKEPTLTQGNIANGETCYCPLFAVTLYGNNVQSIVRKINGFRTLAEIDTWINNNASALNNIGTIKTKVDNNALNIAKKIGTSDLMLRTFSVDNVTIKSGVVYAQRFDVGVSGYTCLGVIGFNVQNASSGGVASTGCNISIAWLETSTTAVLNIRNEVSSDAKVKISVQCLYVRNV